MPNKIFQAWSKKNSYKKPYKRHPSPEERNTKNIFIEELVKRVLNNIATSNNYMMVYDYYLKLLKYYGIATIS